MCYGHFAISSCGMYSDENNKPDTILASNALCADSPVIIILQKIEEKISNIRDQGSKSNETREPACT